MRLTDEAVKTDRDTMVAKTMKDPEWIHFGAGNIFRAFMADIAQTLLEKGSMKTGIIVCEGYDSRIIEKIYRPFDNLCILATLRSDGIIEKKVISSIASSLILDEDHIEDHKKLEQIFEKPSLKMCSFTITEKGYKTPEYIEKIVPLIYHRYKTCEGPVALVSMDNCSHNGDVLYEAVKACAIRMVDEGLAEDGFLSYLDDPSKVSFPWTMIDRITPRPDERILEELKKDGYEDLEPIVTDKNTYIAPFVNAEETGYLVIEDLFPNGRLPLDEAGVIYTDRQTVDAAERMKVCTCLNPLHTALAIFGCLLGYETIHEEMKDEDLSRLVKELGYREGMPVVSDPKVISPADFLDAVLNKRLPNPFMPDSPARIATDTSQKIPVRFGETIKAYRQSDELDAEELVCIPLVIAGYLRYLSGRDDNGNAFEPSPDPLLDELKSMKPEDILRRQDIFANDLYADGLADRILGYYRRMSTGPGAVRKTLHGILRGEHEHE